MENYIELRDFIPGKRTLVYADFFINNGKLYLKSKLCSMKLDFYWEEWSRPNQNICLVLIRINKRNYKLIEKMVKELPQKALLMGQKEYESETKAIFEELEIA